MDLKAPQVTVTIQKSDAQVVVPPPDPAAGTLRLQPQSSSLLDTSRLTSDVHNWANDEDLLNQTVTMQFMNGVAQIPEGQLVYGVTYQIAVFDVPGYQPLISNSNSSNAAVLTAGTITSLAVTLQVDIKAPLRLLTTDADKCTPPAPTANAFAATITLTFSEEIEPAGATLAEDIDAGVSILTGSSSSSSYCPLNASLDATKQERGTHAAIDGKTLTLSFNPAVGFATTTSFGSTCMIPPALTAVIYGNLSNVVVQPKGDPVRKRSLGTMLAEIASGSTFPTSTSSLSCPGHVSQSSF